MDNLTRFSVSLPALLLEDFDRSLEARGYRTRSDAMRQLIRRFITESYWDEGEKTLFGTVTLTYDHHSHDSAREITSLQHEFGDLIICTTISMPIISTASKASYSRERLQGLGNSLKRSAA